MVGTCFAQGSPALSGGAGTGTPVSQAPEPQVASQVHNGIAEGPEVSCAPTTPAPGESRAGRGHRACPRVREPELGSLACDSRASHIGYRSGAQELGIYPVTGEERKTPWVFLLKSWVGKLPGRKWAAH